jgi:polar amino acid transport system substrate-binding protein
VLAKKLEIITHDFPPFSYLNKDGELSDMSVEILTAALKDMNFTDYTISIYPWSRALKSVSNKPNYLLFPFARKKNREANFIWAGKAGPRKISLFKLRSRKDITNNQALKHYQNLWVASMRGTAYTKALSLKEFTNTEETTTPIQSTLLLYRDSVDLVLEDDAVFFHSIKQHNTESDTLSTLAFEKVKSFSKSSDRWFGFGAGTDTTLTNKFIRSYQKLENSGIIRQIVTEYFK